MKLQLIINDRVIDIAAAAKTSKDAVATQLDSAVAVGTLYVNKCREAVPVVNSTLINAAHSTAAKYKAVTAVPFSDLLKKFRK